VKVFKENEMRKGIVFATALVVFTVSGAAVAAAGDLGVDVTAGFVSKYIWHGYDRLDDKSAFQPSVSFDLFGSGFTAALAMSYANASKNGGSVSTVNETEYQYILGYHNSVNGGEMTQVDYAINLVYYDFIDEPDSVHDMYEFNATISMPQICQFGVTPKYTLVYLWPAESDGPSNGVTGSMHVFGLDYDLALGEVIPNNPDQVLKFSWDITYNDGAGAAGRSDRGNPDHDWSHMTWGLSTEITCPMGGKFRPGVYYQTSMEDSVNAHDEFWTGLSYTLSF
jgi:hypothetical protein